MENFDYEIPHIVRWKSASWLPNYNGRGVVFVTEDNKIDMFREGFSNFTWSWLFKKFNVKYWCYIEEVIPRPNDQIKTY